MGQGEVIVRKGLSKQHASLELEIWQWKNKLEQSRTSRHVTKTEVQNFALEAFKKAGINNFKASHGWYHRWRLRWQNRSLDVELPANTSVTEDEVENLSKARFSNTKFKQINTENLQNNKKKQNIDIAVEKVQNTQDKPLKNKIRSELGSFKQKINKEKILNKKVVLFKSIRKKCVLPKNDEVFRQGNSSETSGISITKLNSVDVSIDSFEKSQRALEVSRIKPNCKLLTSNLDCIEEKLLTKKRDLAKSFKESTKIRNISPQLTNESDESSPFLCNLIISKDKAIRENTVETSTISQTEPGFHNVGGIIPSTNKEATITCNISSLSCINNKTLHINNCKSTLEQNVFDFGDHELYCDSCEDFHPLANSSLPECRQVKYTKDSLLDSVQKKTSEVIESDRACLGNKSNSENCEKRRESSHSALKTRKSSVFITKGKRYQVQFKTKVIAYALRHSIKEAASLFSVNRGTISEWLAERKRLLNHDSLKPVTFERKGCLDETVFLSWLENSKFNLTNEIIKQETLKWLQIDKGTHKNCHWIHMYAHRFNGTKHQLNSKRYIAYPDAFKRVVVFYAETHSNIAASRVFNVSRRRVFAWQELFGNSKKLATDEIPHNVTDSVVDKQLFEWYSSQIPSPSSKQVRDKGVELYRAAGHRSIQCSAQWYYRWRARHKLPPQRSQQACDDSPLLQWALAQLDGNQGVTHAALAAQAKTLHNVKASKSWSVRFCKRHHKLLLTFPEPSTPLPEVMELQVFSYRKRLQNIVTSCNISAENIIALDEIPLQFLPQDSNKKPLLMRRSGFESCQASMMISCLADGTLLPAVFVFKGCLPAVQTNTSVVPTMNTSGLVTEEVMELWMASVCIKQIGGTGGLMITDCFGVHTSEGVQKAVATHNIQQAVIPGGCGYKLMPIIHVCQMFKAMLEDMCRSALANQTSALRPPSADQLYLWATGVHNLLAKQQKESIKAAFDNLLMNSS